MKPSLNDKPIRLGIFNSVGQADRALRKLQEVGFTHDELGVLCAERVKDRHFADMPSAKPPGLGPSAIPAGGAIGATVGGLGLAALTIATGGAPIAAAAGLALLGGGAIAGAFAGAMATMNYDTAVAEQYSKAVEEGKILVAVEASPEDNTRPLRLAESILKESGADPVLAVESRVNREPSVTVK